MFWKKKPNDKMQKPIVFIENAGGCICTKSVLEGQTRLKWCFRESSANPADNGWRFIGESDDETYINVASNNAVVDFNTVANLEPAILSIYTLPVGTDLYLERGEDRKMRFFRTGTGEEVEV